MMTFGDRLKIAREFAGLDQPKLAKLAGMTKAAVSNIETGATKAPTPKNTFALADACRVNARWLATEVGEMTGVSEEDARKSVRAERLLILIESPPAAKQLEAIDLIDEMSKVEAKKAKMTA